MDEVASPCPFCGGEGFEMISRLLYVTYAYIECVKCHAKGPMARRQHSSTGDRIGSVCAKQRAIKAWNTRPQAVQMPYRAATHLSAALDIAIPILERVERNLEDGAHLDELPRRWSGKKAPKSFNMRLVRTVLRRSKLIRAS